jgi:hypothetical protein
MAAVVVAVAAGVAAAAGVVAAAVVVKDGHPIPRKKRRDTQRAPTWMGIRY